MTDLVTRKLFDNIAMLLHFSGSVRTPSIPESLEPYSRMVQNIGASIVQPVTRGIAKITRRLIPDTISTCMRSSQDNISSSRFSKPPDCPRSIIYPVLMDLDSPFTSPPSSPDVQAYSEPEEPVPRRAKGRSISRAPGKTVTHCELPCELLRKNALNDFIASCKIGLTSWAYLLRQTTVPKNTRSSDAPVLAAFKTIDSFIMSDNDKVLRRLAYVQLAHLLDSLVDTITTDRTQGLIHRAAGYRNATIAVDIYMSAQQKGTNVGPLRRELLERKRTGQRWLQLAGPSPFTLVLYSDAADQAMYV